MKNIFKPAPLYTTYSISSECKQEQKAPPNTFSHVSSSDIDSPPVRGTVKIIDAAAYDYPIVL